MKTNVQTLVSELLTLADMEIINGFFQSDAPRMSKWVKDGDVTDVFLKRAVENNIQYEFVDCYGGEGMGEECWSVYKFSKDDESVLVKFDGSYASYDGSTFDGWYIVEGRSVQVTQFFKI